MPKIRLDNQKEYAAFIGEYLGMAAKAINQLDLFENDGILAGIPYLKVVQKVAAQCVDITDVDKALEKLFSLSCLAALCRAANLACLPLETDSETLKGIVTNLPEVKAAELDLAQIHNHPAALFLKNELGTLLIESGFDEFNVVRIILRWKTELPIVFHELLEEKSLTFQSLNLYLDSPKHQYKRAALKEEKRKQELRQMFLEPVFGDETGMSLGDVYMEPYFQIHKDCFPKDQELPETKTDFIRLEKCRQLLPVIHDLIRDQQPEYLPAKRANITLLLGYPGQGKSSFCKRILFDLLGENPIDRKVLFKALRYVEKVHGLVHSPWSTLFEELQDDFELTKEEFRESILILDGLDELVMRAAIRDGELQGFLNELSRSCERKEIHVIITSRYGVADLKSLAIKGWMIFQIDETDLEQQLQWLESFKHFHSNTVFSRRQLLKIHQHDDLHHIQELISQPILLHMMVASGIEIAEQLSRTQIYDELFTSLIERSWAKQQIEAVEKCWNSKEELRNAIGDVALAIFHSGNDFITRSNLEDFLNEKRWWKKLVKKEWNDPFNGLMIAFYFNKSTKVKLGHHNDYAIEFLHKSLMEFLTAERILTRLTESFTGKGPSNSTNALQELFDIFSQQPLSPEVKVYLNNLAPQHLSQETWDLLIDFFDEFLKDQFTPRQSGFSISNCINTFTGYWTTIMSEHIPPELINQSNTNYFSFLLKNASAYTPNLSIRNQSLQKSNWSFLPFSSWKFEHTKLEQANFSGSDLLQASFEGCEIERAFFSKARLTQTKFVNCELSGSSFFLSYLLGAEFQNAFLLNASFSSAFCMRTQFIKSDLFRASFSYSNCSTLNNEKFIASRSTLTDSTFKHCSLEEANLIYVNASNSAFINSNLTNIQAIGSFFCGASFYRSNLQGANLCYADLYGIKHWDKIECIENCDLRGVKNAPSGFLEWAKLQGAITGDPQAPLDKLLIEAEETLQRKHEQMKNNK